MRHLLTCLSVMVLLAFLASCIETKQTLTLNPDGSGKVAFDTLISVTIEMGGQKKDIKTQVRDTVGKFISDSKGVEAWSDVSYEIVKDGHIHIHGVAYFSDLGKLKIDPVPAMTWNPQAKTLQLADLPAKKETAVEPAIAAAATPEQVAEKLQEARVKYQSGRHVMLMMFSELKINVNYQLPGKVQKASGFTKTGDNGVLLHVEGTKLIANMDKLVGDDQRLTKLLRTSGGEFKLAEEPGLAAELVFGQPLLAELNGELKPAFDYKKQMGAAKAGQDAMFQQINLEVKAGGTDVESPGK